MQVEFHVLDVKDDRIKGADRVLNTGIPLIQTQAEEIR
jgi:hypothetical protein